MGAIDRAALSALQNATNVAIVGSGISGLACAWLLSQRHRVTLFEAAPRLGGHTNTVDVTLDGKTHPVDTGFLVFNEKTYPNLIALFATLGVESVQTEMSFAVSLENPDLEWAGSSLATVFGQKRNLLRPAFWTMLSDILRFNRESTAWLAVHPGDERPLGDFLKKGRYSDAFADWYLLPMAAAIWSCPTPQPMTHGAPCRPSVRPSARPRGWCCPIPGCRIAASCLRPWPRSRRAGAIPGWAAAWRRCWPICRRGRWPRCSQGILDNSGRGRQISGFALHPDSS